MSKRKEIVLRKFGEEPKEEDAKRNKELGFCYCVNCGNRGDRVNKIMVGEYYMSVHDNVGRYPVCIDCVKDLIKEYEEINEK